MGLKELATKHSVDFTKLFALEEEREKLIKAMMHSIYSLLEEYTHSAHQGNIFELTRNDNNVLNLNCLGHTLEFYPYVKKDNTFAEEAFNMIIGCDINKKESRFAIYHPKLKKWQIYCNGIPRDLNNLIPELEAILDTFFSIIQQRRLESYHPLKLKTSEKEVD